MTYMAVAYGLSIGVIIVVLFVALLHPKVPTGVIGTLILGGILAVCNQPRAMAAAVFASVPVLELAAGGLRLVVIVLKGKPEGAL